MWKKLFENTQLNLIIPSVDELIHSTRLPLHHKDPFAGILITQAKFSFSKVSHKR